MCPEPPRGGGVVTAWMDRLPPTERRAIEEMKKLENLRWKNRWTSHLGCIKGCLDYLNLDVTDAWLFGATGHAFIINVADTDV